MVKGIDGSTSLVAVLGHPIEHSLSPTMHNAAFRALDMNWIYVACDVVPEQLVDALRGAQALGLRGLNLTVSLKEVAARAVDRLAKSADRLGSVNTIEMTEDGLVGHNTDGTGFVRSVQEDLGMSLSGKHVVVVGAGGAAAAILHAALDAGADFVTVANRTFERGVRLCETAAETVGKAVPVRAIPLKDLETWQEKVDLVVNATSLGWQPDDPVPVPEVFLLEGISVLDTCYNPQGTPLLEAARQRGLPCADGLGMLVYQGAAAFEIWTGQEAPVEVMKEALRAEGI
jgi:shikimate dehydrogenase